MLSNSTGILLKVNIFNTEVLLTDKKIPEDERLNNLHYYELRHGADNYIPETIENNVLVNFFGTVISKVPLNLNDNGFLELSELEKEYIIDINIIDEIDILQENGIEWVENVIYWLEKVQNKANLIPLIERSWAMPNKNTTSIKPIKELIKQEVNGGFWIDPFANSSKIAHITNDLNLKFDTNFHMDALDFLKMIPDNYVDGVIFDPPFSPRQIKEAYESVGLDTQGGKLTRSSFWSNLKDEISRVCKDGAKVISFGWNTMGMGKNRGFNLNRILLVGHGGNHNDTIVTVEVKSSIPVLKHFKDTCLLLSFSLPRDINRKTLLNNGFVENKDHQFIKEFLNYRVSAYYGFGKLNIFVSNKDNYTTQLITDIPFDLLKFWNEFWTKDTILKEITLYHRNISKNNLKGDWNPVVQEFIKRDDLFINSDNSIYFQELKGGLAKIGMKNVLTSEVPKILKEYFTEKL